MAHVSRGRRTYSRAELDNALVHELRTGIKLKEALEERREIQAAHDAREAKMAKEMPGLGKRVFTMPDWEFFNLCNKYGHAEVHSKGFMQYAQEKFPHLAAGKV